MSSRLSSVVGVFSYIAALLWSSICRLLFNRFSAKRGPDESSISEQRKSPSPSRKVDGSGVETRDADGDDGHTGGGADDGAPPSSRTHFEPNPDVDDGKPTEAKLRRRKRTASIKRIELTKNLLSFTSHDTLSMSSGTPSRQYARAARRLAPLLSRLLTTKEGNAEVGKAIRNFCTPVLKKQKHMTRTYYRGMDVIDALAHMLCAKAPRDVAKGLAETVAVVLWGVGSLVPHGKLVPLTYGRELFHLNDEKLPWVSMPGPSLEKQGWLQRYSSLDGSHVPHYALLQSHGASDEGPSTPSGAHQAGIGRNPWQLVLFSNMWDDQDVELLRAMTRPIAGIPLLKRESLRSRGMRSFKGSKAVKWAMEKGYATCQDEAISLMEGALQRGLIEVTTTMEDARAAAESAQPLFVATPLARYRFPEGVAAIIGAKRAETGAPILRLPLEGCTLSISRDSQRDVAFLSLGVADAKKVKYLSGKFSELKSSSLRGKAKRRETDNESLRFRVCSWQYVSVREWVSCIGSAMLLGTVRDDVGR